MRSMRRLLSPLVAQSQQQTSTLGARSFADTAARAGEVCVLF